MIYSVDQLIRQVGDLPPMPQAAQKALELIRDPESSANELGRVLSVDQVLTGTVLRWANSAHYGMGNRVSTVQQGITVLGMNAIEEIILASSVAHMLNRALPGYDLKQGDLWRHSIGVAIGSRLIAEKRGMKAPEEAYHAGLLCDIGKLAFEKLLRASDVHLEDWQSGSFLELERTHFGLDHAMLGAEMARRWNLPEEIVTVIAHHHNPENAQKYRLLTSIVHVADAAMMILGVGLGKDGLRYSLVPEALNQLEMTDKDLIGLFEQIVDQIWLTEIFIGVSGNKRS